MTAHSDLSTGVLDWSTLTGTPVAAQILARSLSGNEMSISLFDLEPGAIVPRHAHPNEEFGYVVRGDLRLTTGALVDEPLMAGDSFFVSANDPHTAVAGPDGCQLLECYAPPRVPAPTQETTP